MKIRDAIAVSGILLFVCGQPEPVLAKEKAATVTYDPYTKTTAIIGQTHLHNPLLDLDKWQYWLSGAIAHGVPKNPVLMFSTNTQDWYFFDRAADVDGNELPVLKGNREVATGWLTGDVEVHEVFGIQLTPKYLADHRTTGFNFKIIGSKGERMVVVPPEAVATFETTYLAEVEKAGGFRDDLAATDAALAPTPGQIAQASKTGAAALAAKGGFGVAFGVIPQGILLVAVAPGSRAELGKLRVGQLVTAINGKSIAGLAQADVLAILRASTGVTTFTVAGVGDLPVAP